MSTTAEEEPGEPEKKSLFIGLSSDALASARIQAANQGVSVETYLAGELERKMGGGGFDLEGMGKNTPRW